MSQLPSPPPGQQSPVEVLRAWIADGQLECSLQGVGMTDPGDWGGIFADLARHLAGAFAEIEGKPPEETLRLIRDHFLADLEAPGGESA
jgi:hypothetical protein